MRKNGATNSPRISKPNDGITRIIVGGFKSLAQEQSVEIRPLTILAGANSSGKSSIMQPLLLLKQTLEASYDPGALLLDGANLKFTLADQLFSRTGPSQDEEEFHIGFEVSGKIQISTYFQKMGNGEIDVVRMHYATKSRSIAFRKGMNDKDIRAQFKNYGIIPVKDSLAVERNRCFLGIIPYGQVLMLPPLALPVLELQPSPFKSPPISNVEQHITKIIHIPGLRGNPSRTYPVTAVESSYPGTFERYTASIINKWQEEKELGVLAQLNNDLKLLGLTWKVTARRMNDTQVEIQVGRLPQSAQGGARDLVSIADVGFGVSQTLPILVALYAAKPGQLVYIEQPELHLHPRAQTAMAKVLVNAAKRGVRVVAETHSDLLLLGVQTEVAKGHLPADAVILHWFSRAKNGTTKITSADLDESGNFGDWPEDFSEVRLHAERDYLDSPQYPVKSG
jgi:predicted ATPase